ncbi:MAG: hypothetical protein JWN04_201 [Myxococcaceae bacterium]|nr:hypothetical protein [Myxococcaceae bacterium]
MRTAISISILVLAAASTAGCNHGGDLEKVCAAFTQLAAEPRLPEMSHDARMNFVNERVQERLWSFSQVESLWRHVPNYESEARYRMFQRTAQDLLGREWHCPDMERLAPTLSVPAQEVSQ